MEPKNDAVEDKFPFQWGDNLRFLSPLVFGGVVVLILRNK